MITDILAYPFFRHALFGLLILSLVTGVIGTYIISRRMVSIAGGVTHACFGGLGLGYYLGINPVATAAVVAVASALGVDTMSRRLSVREDSAVAVIWAVGMAAGIIFVFLTPGYVPELNSFLFGNILSVSVADIYVLAAFAAALLAFVAAKFHTIVAVAFDRDFARVAGLPVGWVSTVMTVFVAVCIVLTIKMVGIMLLMSMLSLPQIIAETFTSRFRTIAVASTAISAAGSVAGLFASAYVNAPCSALIVATLCLTFVVAKCTSLPRNARSA